MVGTRLAVHTTFVVELLLLTIASFLYATHRNNGDISYSSLEPFLVDQSGWKILVEDVSAVPENDGGVVARIADVFDSILSKINHLLELETEEKSYQTKPRLPSVFVNEMRQQLSQLSMKSSHNDGVDSTSRNMDLTPQYIPLLEFSFFMPQFNIDAKDSGIHPVAQALELGFLKQAKTSAESKFVRYAKFVVNPKPESKGANESFVASCDDWKTNPMASVERIVGGQRRSVKHPRITLLTGCTRDVVPEPQMASVEIDQLNGNIVVRTTHNYKRSTNADENEMWNDLRQFVENNLSTFLWDVLFPTTSTPYSNSDLATYKIRGVSIELIDEDPTTHSRAMGENDGIEGFTAKQHFDLLGRALSKSSKSIINPILEDLSFVYGGVIELENANVGKSQLYSIVSRNVVGLSTHSSAFVSVPDDMIELNAPSSEVPSLKSISIANFADWMKKVIGQNKKTPGIVNWVLFVPSKPHSPLKVHTKSLDDTGSSIILSSPSVVGDIDHATSAGLSLVNLVDKVESVDDGQNYEDSVSISLTYLVGFLRAIHGLPTAGAQAQCSNGSTSTTMLKCTNTVRNSISFWELESIARQLWHFKLEQTLNEMDALMSLLRTHSSTLAFPKQVAHKLNNSTNLLRQSISLIEGGYPVIYALSTLSGSFHLLEELQNDHEMMELSYFAPDHYLAVFSPLLLPLLLPMIVGLVREIKRFRELKKKKDKKLT